jgi:hypothetical protein
MARNGSGTMSILNSFSSGTTISSTAMNANNTDIASEITGSLPRDGQAAMTGQLKAASGSVAAPGITFSADLDCGLYRIGANDIALAAGGSRIQEWDTGGSTIVGALTVTGAAALGSTLAVTGAVTQGGVAVTAFPSGTAMLFAQTSAPSGWTKSTSHNDKALRVVSGTASSGGSVAFTTAFASQSVAGTVGNTALSEAQLPSHKHFGYADIEGGGSTVTASNQAGVFRQVAADTDYNIRGTATAATLGLSSATGSGDTHTHTFTGTAINLAVQYLDCIVATKD